MAEISKYILFLLMLVYAAECFLSFRVRDEASVSGVCIRQSIWMFAIQSLMFVQIIANTGDVTYLIYYAAQLLLLLATPVAFHRLYPAANRPLINQMCLMLMIGMTVILRIDAAKWRRQFLIVVFSVIIGLVIIRLMQMIPSPERLMYVYGAAGLAILFVVRLLGSTTFGAQITYTLLGVSGQPSEFVKILFIFFVAGMLCKSTSLTQVIIASAAGAAHVLVLVWSRDLGGALIFFVVYLSMLFVATRNPLYPAAGLILGVGASLVAFRAFSHVRARVMIFLDPWSTIDSTGYQITQALFAISGGGFFGMGLFGGMPTATPIVEKDLIFCAVAEELGIGFALVMLSICVATFLIFLRESYAMRETFPRLVTLGIGVIYIFQVFLTVGGTAKFIPLTGVTLPLVSYGGSSVLATILMFSIFESFAGAPEEKKTNERERSLPIPALAVFFSALFVVMGAYIAWHGYADRRELMSNAYNRRQALYMRSVERGKIYASDRSTILAGTVIGEDGRQTRVYPYGEVFSHAVGYAVRDKAGVEALANYDLLHSGIHLGDRSMLAGEGRLFPGNDVVTTLDVRLQTRIYEAMGDYHGAVIVTNPRTGEILAMVSKPSFDPGSVDATWDELTADPEAGILVNRTTRGLYPTGSTFKIITTLAYMRAHPADYASYQYQCYGSFTTAGETIHCFDGIPHGAITLAQSFALSCNSSFVNIGVNTDRALWAKTLEDLYFARALPGELRSNISTTSDPVTCTVPDLMQLSIGQGETSMTPLHLNLITCAVANGGMMMKPYLISDVVNAYGANVEHYTSTRAARLMSAEEAAGLTELMRGVVTEGTGRALAGKPYTSAGKTGSAEHGTGLIDDAHAWFTGFAPAENPEICVTLVLEDAGSSASYAVPLAGIVFDTWFENR